MGFDPIRSRNNPASPAVLRVVEGRSAGARRPAAAGAGSASSAAPDPIPAADNAGGETPPRVDLIRARIASDFYGQAHVRERILSALLRFLDE